MFVSKAAVSGIDTTRPLLKSELARALYGEAYEDSTRRKMMATLFVKHHMKTALHKLGYTKNSKLIQPPCLNLIKAVLLQELDNVDARVTHHARHHRLRPYWED